MGDSESDAAFLVAAVGGDVHLEESVGNVNTDIMTFEDETAVVEVGDRVAPPISMAQTSTGYLGDFLSRWTLINTSTWTSTVTSGQQIGNHDVWRYYLTNPTIAKKIANFYKIRGTLELNIILTAAPTQYGHMVVNCVAQGTEAIQEDIVDTYGGHLASHDTLPTIYQSCQGIYGDLAPALSESLHIILPWIYPADMLDLTTISTTGTLGGGPQTQYRVLYQCIAPLSNATDAANVTPVTIRMYARLTDVVLDVPMAAQAFQVEAKVVQQRGVVGKAADAVTRASRILQEVPVIGGLAKGAEIVSSAVGAVADYFGFTKERIVAVNRYFRPLVAAGAGNIDNNDTSIVMGYSAQNAVSIDPVEFGISEKVDVESFASLFKRKTLADTITWDSQTAAGTTIFTLGVSPEYYSNPSGQAANYRILSPVGYVSEAFQYWRGPMYYEIRVMCSSLHRGRLQVVYEAPSYVNVTSSDDPTNYTFNKIFDINANKTMTFKVGYAHNLPMLPLQGQYSMYNDGGEVPVNGRFNILVNTELTAPDPTASVTVEVWYYSDGDMQFAGPIKPSGFVVQAGPDVNTTGASETTLCELVPSTSRVDISAVIGGEKIQSVRSLMQRYDFYSMPNYSGNANAVAFMNDIWSDASSTPSNGQYYDLMEYFTRMYVGYRGSIRYKFYLSTLGRDILVGKLSRDLSVATATTQPAAIAAAVYTQLKTQLSGPQPYPAILGGVPEWTMPYYASVRYKLSRYYPSQVNVLSDFNNVAMIGYDFSVVLDDIQSNVVRAAGPDFSVGRFRFIPAIVVQGPGPS